MTKKVSDGIAALSDKFQGIITSTTTENRKMINCRLFFHRPRIKVKGSLDIPWITCCDHGYGRPSWRPRVSDPATYRSGTPRNQHPAVARWHAHLRGLATAIHEISGLAICFTFILATLHPFPYPTGRILHHRGKVSHILLGSLILARQLISSPCIVLNPRSIGPVPIIFW